MLRIVNRALATTVILALAAVGLAAAPAGAAVDCSVPGAPVIEQFSMTPNTLTAPTGDSVEHTTLAAQVESCGAEQLDVRVNVTAPDSQTRVLAGFGPSVDPDGRVAAELPWGAGDVGDWTFTLVAETTDLEGVVQQASATLPFKVAAPAPVLTVPSEPLALAVVARTAIGGGLSWQAPATDGGSEVTAYRIVMPGTDVEVAGAARSYTVGNLQPGSSYTVSVQARNAQGYGPTSTVTLTTLATAPAKPNAVKVTNRSATTGTVSWQAPTTDGGSVVTAYRIVLPGTDVEVDGTARSYSVGSLQPASSYTISVQARNAQGYGPASTVRLTTLATVPARPSAVKVTKRGTTSGSVAWQRPASDGGSTITAYQIVKPGTDVTVKATARSYTIAGLKPGHSYAVKVRAKNAHGYGPSAAVTLTTLAIPPSKPRSLAVSKRTRTSGKVSWRAPSSDGGAAITGYLIVKPGRDVTVKATARSYTVKGLKPGHTYTIKIKAKNARGYGRSASVTLKTTSGGGGNCTPGYSPCLPPASDYDCAGGSGNGPKYAYGPIYVTGSDPYDLDRDGDGVACES